MQKVRLDYFKYGCNMEIESWLNLRNKINLGFHLTCKDLRSQYSILIKGKAEQTEKSTTPLRSIAGVRSRGKLLCPELKRQTVRYRKWQLPEQTHQQKPPRELVLGRETWTAMALPETQSGQVWKLKNPGELTLGQPAHLVSFTSRTSTRFSHEGNIREKKIPYISRRSREK